MTSLRPGERLVVVRALGGTPVRSGDQVVVVRIEPKHKSVTPVAPMTRTHEHTQPALQCCFESECPNTPFGHKCHDMCCSPSMGTDFIPKLYKRWSELFTSAFGLIAALAWNSAVQELIEETDLKQQQKFYYAAAVTAAAVVVAYVLEMGGHFLTIGWDAAMNSVHALGHSVVSKFAPSRKQIHSDAYDTAVLLTATEQQSIGSNIRLDFTHVGGLNEWQDVVQKTN